MLPCRDQFGHRKEVLVMEARNVCGCSHVFLQVLPWSSTGSAPTVQVTEPSETLNRFPAASQSHGQLPPRPGQTTHSALLRAVLSDEIPTHTPHVITTTPHFLNVHDPSAVNMPPLIREPLLRNVEGTLTLPRPKNVQMLESRILVATRTHLNELQPLEILYRGNPLPQPLMIVSQFLVLNRITSSQSDPPNLKTV